MSLRHFVRKSRIVKIGGRKLGPWHLGGRSYRFEPISLLRMVQWLECAGRLKVETVSELPLEVLRAMIPLSVAGVVREVDLERATPQQIGKAALAAAEVSDLQYVLGALFTPTGDSGKGRVGIEAAVCAVAQRYGQEPRTVWLWPAAEFAAVLEAEKQLVPDDRKSGEPHVCTPDEVDELNRRLSAFGVEVVDE